MEDSQPVEGYVNEMTFEEPEAPVAVQAEAPEEAKESMEDLKARMRAAFLSKVASSSLKGGDEADEVIGPKIECIKQVEEGQIGSYMIGGKKTSAKMLNGNLLIKVGGGWVTLDEFIMKYLQTMNSTRQHAGDKDVLVREKGNTLTKKTSVTTKEGRSSVGDKSSPTKRMSVGIPPPTATTKKD